MIILDFGRDDDSGKQKSPPHSLSLPFRLVMAQIIEIRGFEFSSFGCSMGLECQLNRVCAFIFDIFDDFSKFRH